MAINPYVLLPAVIIIALLQTTFVPVLSFADLRPDLMLVFVVAWTLLRGRNEGMIWGFAGGIAVDLLAGTPVGISALTLMAASAIAGAGQRNLLSYGFWLPLIIIGVASLATGLMHIFLLTMLGYALTWGATLVSLLFPATVANIVLMAFFFPLFRWFNRRLGRPQLQW